MSGTLKNFIANASSKKPSTTFMRFIQAPLFGVRFINEGNMAKSEKGTASANAKPSIPIAGASRAPEVTVCTNNRPTIGAVHEKLTRTRVKAMRKIDSNPVVLLALVSTLLAQLSGNFISNQPKKLSANTTSSAKRNMLNTACVDSALSVLGPKRAVTPMPNVRKMITIEAP